MFTGIIQEIGKITEVRKVGGGLHFVVTAPQLAAELAVNDSIAVNGVCQTVIERNGASFKVEAVEETLKKTTLEELKAGAPVNLELPLRLSDRVGGHMVQGHVDGVGVVRSVVKKESSWLITVAIPGELLRYVIPVGSIALDGVSLTVASLEGTGIVVSIIPHTLEKTILADVAPGKRVNVEVDMVGKYIERLLGYSREGGAGLSPQKLAEWGYGG